MQAPGRTLVVRFGAMGDMIMFTAILRRLAQHHGAPVDVMTSHGASARILAGCPSVGTVLTVPHRHAPWWWSAALRRSVTQAAERGYSLAYQFEPVTGLATQLGRAGCTVVPVQHAADGRGKHNIDNDHVAFDLLGVPRIDGCDEPSVVVTDRDRADAAAVLARRGITGPVLVMQVGSGRSMRLLHRWRQNRVLKSWPVASWAGLVAAIAAQRPDLPIVFAGAPAESVDIDDVRQALPEALRGRTWNLADELPIGALTGLLAGATACISVDTGPAHLAAAVGCPLVVLFGPASHLECRPRGVKPVQVVAARAPCSPCHGTPLVKTCRNNICMQGISVAEVLAAWTALRT